MRGSLFVQSPRSVAILWSAKYFRTSSEGKTSFLFVWHVAHQRAVKSTYTIRPSSRNFVTASGLHASHTTSGAPLVDVCATAARGQPTQSPSAPTRNKLAKPKRARPADAPGAVQR